MIKNVPTVGDPTSKPARSVKVIVSGTRWIHSSVNRAASRPVRPKASAVTGIGSSSQRFTSYR